MRRRYVLVAAAVLLALVAGCARPFAGRVTRAAARPSLPRVASAAASSAVSALASAAVEPTAAVVVLDPAPYLGRPVRRAPWPTDKVALTLDDGPSKHTAEVLAIFERYGIRATFFYIGNRTPRYRREAAEAARAGFEIANHTWDHEEIEHEPRAFDLAEIDRGQAELESVTGTRSVFVRPPAGHWDDTALRAITDRGLVMALWSLHGHDTGPGTHATTIARGVIGSARGGDVILLHETNAETIAALPRIIEGLRAKGLRPVTLSELLTR